MMIRIVALWLTALVLALGSTIVHPNTDERAMYGSEGPWELNWKPRVVAGWPAPFLADSPSTSVPYKIGVEDEFRPGPFLATWSFWLIVTLAGSRALRWLRQR
jgi:hypothetical protein